MTANGLSEKKNSILEINDLCFAYPEEKKRALNHVSLHVEDGEFLVLCGKSVSSCCGACARSFRTSTTSPGTRITDTRPTPTLKMSLTWNGT